MNDVLKLPLAIYDVEDKKCVMLFYNYNSCLQYLFGSKTKKISISDYIKNKNKLKKTSTKFNRVLCFRDANVQQVKMLGNREYLILDDRFQNEGKPLEKFI